MPCFYKDFNNGIKLFLKELIRNFPHVGALSAFLTAFKLLKLINKKLPHKWFQDLVNIPYGSYIAVKDDSFFTSPDFKTYPLYQHFIPLLRETWCGCDVANKDAIWSHLQFVITLNQKIINYRVAKKLPPIENLSIEVIENEPTEDD